MRLAWHPVCKPLFGAASGDAGSRFRVLRDAATVVDRVTPEAGAGAVERTWPVDRRHLPAQSAVPVPFAHGLTPIARERAQFAISA
jgi:hypothetical protein